jgi:hypothetical protein
METKMRIKEINIDKEINLLQEIRLIHSLYDSGYSLWVGDNNYQKMKPIFDNFSGVVNVGKSDNGISFREVTTIIHKTPETKFNGQVKPLIFPKSLIEFCEKEWVDDRLDKVLFTGLLTKKRENIINRFNSLKLKELIYKNQNNGRVFPVKSFDKNYFTEMSTYNFVFCPDGDFIWTYRFFESIMCGSIPIVENECDIFKGFKYYKVDDDLTKITYNMNWVLDNLEHLKTNFTI